MFSHHISNFQSYGHHFDGHPSIFPIQCQLLPIRAMDVGELDNFPGPTGSWPMGQDLPLEGYGMHPMKTMVIIMVLEF